MAGQKIRIRLKAYDHEVIDKLGAEDRRHRDAYRRARRRAGAAAHGEERVLRHPLSAQVQGLARALRDADAQAADRHHRPDAEDGGLADAPRPLRRASTSRSSSEERTDMGKQIKGILGTKLGMTQVFNDAGQIVPVTVVQAGPCVVTAVRTPGTDGYSAVQLGFGEIDPRKVTKPVSGVFEKAGPDPAQVPGRAADRRRVGVHARAGGHRRGVRQRAARRRDRQEQGQGHGGRHEAARLQGARLPRTEPSASTARPAPSARARPPAGCSRACGWRAGWAACAPPCSRSPCTPSTPSAGCS